MINEAVLQGEDPEPYIEQLEDILGDPENGISSEVANDIITCFQSNIF